MRPHGWSLARAAHLDRTNQLRSLALVLLATLVHFAVGPGLHLQRSAPSELINHLPGLLHALAGNQIHARDRVLKS